MRRLGLKVADPDQGVRMLACAWLCERWRTMWAWSSPVGKTPSRTEKLVEACIRMGPGLACWAGYQCRVFLARCWSEFSREPGTSNLIYDDSGHPSGIETFLVARGVLVLL